MPIVQKTNLISKIKQRSVKTIKIGNSSITNIYKGNFRNDNLYIVIQDDFSHS